MGSSLSGLARAATLLLGVGAAACSSASTGDASARDGGVDASVDAGKIGCLICQEASFPDVGNAVIVQDALDQICGSPDGCHGSGAGNFGIRPGSELDAMVNVTSYENPPMKRVRPGHPEDSYVYLKLRCEGGITGSCMPASGGAEPALAAIFHDWIEAGAPSFPQ